VTEQIPLTLVVSPDQPAVETTVSPAWLYEHYRLTILAAEGSYPDKIRRVQAGVALARERGEFTPAQCDDLDRLAARALHATLHPEEVRNDDGDW